jgi:hypothetical protein
MCATGTAMNASLYTNIVASVLISKIIFAANATPHIATMRLRRDSIISNNPKSAESMPERPR